MTSLASGSVTRDTLFLPLLLNDTWLGGKLRDSRVAVADGELIESESSREERVRTGRHCDDVEVDVTSSSRN